MARDCQRDKTMIKSCVCMSVCACVLVCVCVCVCFGEWIWMFYLMNNLKFELDKINF